MLSFTENKDEIIKYLISRGFLVSPDFFEKIKEEFDVEELCEKLENCNPKPFILSEGVFLSLKEKKNFTDNVNFEIVSEEKEENKLVILKNYVEVNKKKEVMDFVDYFRARYNSLKNLLMNRPELQNATSINRILNKSDKDRVALIGIVRD